MLRNRRLRHFENFNQRVHIELTMVAMGKLLNDANPTFVTESAKGLCELPGDDNSCWHAYVDIFELMNISIGTLNGKRKRRRDHPFLRCRANQPPRANGAGPRSLG